jgi:branched-chain amino acid transport system ATP-binding protein
MLEVAGVSAGYGQVRVLEAVAITVGAGECVAILGSNGAGKTTLFRTLFGFTTLYEGTISYDGDDARARPAFELARAGLVHVPEGRGLFPGMTVLENLTVPVHAAAKPRRRELRANLELVFEVFPRLQDRTGQAAGTLSGGEQQMLSIARGLMASPRVLLLDEPSIGLAPKLVDEVFERLRLIREIHPEMGVLIVEQSVAETIALCDRGYIMERGRIVHAGDRAELERSSVIEQAFLGTYGATA